MLNDKVADVLDSLKEWREDESSKEYTEARMKRIDKIENLINVMEVVHFHGDVSNVEEKSEKLDTLQEIVDSRLGVGKTATAIDDLMGEGFVNKFTDRDVIDKAEPEKAVPDFQESTR